jgi:hypothetical protein
MGNAGSYRQAGNQPQQDARSLLQADLPKFILQARIGNGKFMKTYSVRVDGVPLVVKIYLKLSDEDLQSVANRLSYNGNQDYNVQQQYRQSQHFSFEEAFDIAANQNGQITIDQKTIEENRRLLAEIANNRSRQFESYNARDFQSARGTSTYESFSSSSGEMPYSSKLTTKSKSPEPVMSPVELQSTVKESLVILVEIILSTTSSSELKSNEIAAEFAQKLKNLQPKFSDVIDKALTEGGKVNISLLLQCSFSIKARFYVHGCRMLMRCSH